jgi:hypothetical protein
VGYYTDTNGDIHNFLFDGTNYTTLAALPSMMGYGQSITGYSHGMIAGTYNTPLFTTAGFLYDGTNYNYIFAPSGTHGTEITGYSDGKVVGNFTDIHQNSLGFLYDGTNYTTIVDPLAAAIPQPLLCYPGVVGISVPSSPKPTATPKASSTPKATPSPKPSAEPKVKTSPAPKPSSTPKALPTPKASPSPKPSATPKPKSTPAPTFSGAGYSDSFADSFTTTPPGHWFFSSNKLTLSPVRVLLSPAVSN